MTSVVVSLLTWWVTPCNHTLVFSYCEVLLWLDLIAVVLFLFFSLVGWYPSLSKHAGNLEINLRGQPARFGGRQLSNLVWSWSETIFVQAEGFKWQFQPSAGGSWIPGWWQSALTSNFCRGFLLPDPADQQPDTPSPRATADSRDKASTLTRLQLLYQVSGLFMLWRMFLCLFEKLWASGLQRGGKKTLPGLENRAITMLSQCFLPLFSLTLTARCNLSLRLF